MPRACAQFVIYSTFVLLKSNFTQCTCNQSGYFLALDSWGCLSQGGVNQPPRSTQPDQWPSILVDEARVGLKCHDVSYFTKAP